MLHTSERLRDRDFGMESGKRLRASRLLQTGEMGIQDRGESLHRLANEVWKPLVRPLPFRPVAQRVSHRKRFLSRVSEIPIEHASG